MNYYKLTIYVLMGSLLALMLIGCDNLSKNKLQSKLNDELYEYHKRSLNNLIRRDASFAMVVIKQGIKPKDMDAYADKVMKSVANDEAGQMITVIDKRYYPDLIKLNNILNVIGKYPNELNISETTIQQIRDISEQANGTIGDRLGEYVRSHGK